MCRRYFCMIAISTCFVNRDTLPSLFSLPSLLLVPKIFKQNFLSHPQNFLLLTSSPFAILYFMSFFAFNNLKTRKVSQVLKKTEFLSEPKHQTIMKPKLWIQYGNLEHCQAMANMSKYKNINSASIRT